MLRVIDLYVIQKIFDGAKVKLGLAPRALYIQCLEYHFRELPPTTASCTAFEIYHSDFNKHFDSYKPSFEALQKAGLVTVNMNNVFFHNTWGAHIDRTRLDKSSPEEFVGGFKANLADFYADELYNNQSAAETCQMKHNMSKEEVLKMMMLFVKEKVDCKQPYQNYKSFMSDFYYYVRVNQRFGAKKSSSGLNTLEAMSEAAKKLGLNS